MSNYAGDALSIGAWATVATALGSALLFLLKHIVVKAIDKRLSVALETLKHKHAEDLEVLKAQLATFSSSAHLWAEARFAGIRQLGESGYRARNYCRDLSSSAALRSSEAVRATLAHLIADYEAGLFSNRLLLPEGTFFAAHDLKVQLVRFQTLLEASKPGEAEPPGQKTLLEKWEEIDHAWNCAIRLLKNEQLLISVDDNANARQRLTGGA